MGIDETGELNNNPNHIPYIYNFCDRWCQKCGCTTNCEASAVPDNFEVDDVKNISFWQEIEKYIPEIQKLVIETATEKDLSLTEFEAPKQKKNFDLFQRDAKSNNILKAGRLYEDMVDDWFDDAIENHVIEIVETPSGSAHKLVKEIQIKNSNQLNDMFEVVLRYQLQVYLKLSRTFYSKGVEAETEKSEPLDSLGTAKAVLSLLDRSLAAWGIILQNRQFDYDSAFDMLLLIIRLRNNTETEFPDARKFARPGLD